MKKLLIYFSKINSLRTKKIPKGKDNRVDHQMLDHILRGQPLNHSISPKLPKNKIKIIQQSLFFKAQKINVFFNVRRKTQKLRYQKRRIKNQKQKRIVSSHSPQSIVQRQKSIRILWINIIQRCPLHLNHPNTNKEKICLNSQTPLYKLLNKVMNKSMNKLIL